MERTYIIAEIGVNHNGDLNEAKRLIHAAKSSGADAVKVQIFKAKNVVNELTELAQYQRASGLANQLDLIRNLELPYKSFLELQEECQKNSIDFLASTFDSESMNFAVDSLKLKYLKIASGEITNSQHLFEAGSSGLPIILSTGTASIGEVEQALSVICCGIIGLPPTQFNEISDVLASQENWECVRSRVKLMHCSSNYPASFSELNLKAIENLKKSFGLEVGYSDHSPGSLASVVAIALGATLIEKHLTLDKKSAGPDHAASLDVKEFSQMVQDVRVAESTLGDGRKILSPAEFSTREVIRRALFTTKSLSMGDAITIESINAIRSQTGIKSRYFFEVIGRTLAKDVAANSPLTWSDLK
jgi:N-acetylneuraminate synthase